MSGRFFFFIDTATTEIYTLSLHDALPIWKTLLMASSVRLKPLNCSRLPCVYAQGKRDRKSGSAGMPRPISYAVFCLKKKNDVHVAGRQAKRQPELERLGIRMIDV